MTKRSIQAMREYRTAFITVLGHLDAEGVPYDKAPRLLGITKREFNKCALAAAAATWDRVVDDLAVMDKSHDPFLIAALVTNMGNVHEVLARFGGDMQSDAGFAPLKVKKQAFENYGYDVVMMALTWVESRGAQMATRFGPWDFVGVLDKCMQCAGLDPANEQLYKDTGFESRAHFEKTYADCVEKAQRVKLETICPTHHHPS
ncbi:hypothetical protein [Micavibrio aeruginosavorus]|uniref:Uncharacterized protein n=1 Tax=Micavibrio aeruginosavorus EPB TaxID=349215 RepID=M4VCI7_9BACT|nr:hypothetical protein [Micavibrio aeruginosavorus]AGH97092.1 hypothetical protein A11S_256 [Micavibrio aeruginosavorus EPB]